MSIASEITSMGENLKKDYQSIANLGADLTNVDKNIENIAELLDNVYDTLPKTSFQEGTEVTIENGLKGKIDFDDGKVGFGQASQETTTGINLLNYITNLKTNFQGLISQINDDGSITTTGTPTYNYTGIIDMMITDMLEIGQDYTISQKTANPYLYLQINAKNTQTSQESYYLLNNTTSRTFTAQANTTYILRLQTPTTGGWGTDSKTITNFYQLEKGSTAHTFEKYTGGYASPSPNWEQPIQCVTGNQDVVVSGKNLINPNQYLHAVVNATIGSTGTLSEWATSWTTWFEMKPNQTYVFSGNLSNVNSNVVRAFVTNSEVAIGTSGTRVDNLQNGGTYTNTSSYKYLVLEFLDVTTYGGNWQIEEGSTATSYEPYHTPITYPISLGNIELHKIGNYQDYLYKSGDKWYKKEQIGKVVLNGSSSENWSRTGTQTSGNYYFYADNLITPKYDNNNKFYGMSTIGITTSPYGESQGIDTIYYSSQNRTRVYADTTKAMSTTEFKNWLSTNNVIIYYVLETETDTEITDTTMISQLEDIYNLMSYTGTTILEVDGDLPMIIKVRALKGE